MAEALAALGVAANVAQFIEIAIKAASIIIHTYESNDGLLRETNEFLLVAQGVKSQSEMILNDVSATNDKNLQRILADCIALAGELEHEIKRAMFTSGELNRLERIWQSTIAYTRKKKIDDLYKRMIQLRNQISFRLESLVRYVCRHKLSRVALSLGCWISGRETKKLHLSWTT